MNKFSQQQNLWKNIYLKEYINRNPHTDHHLGLKAWGRMFDEYDKRAFDDTTF